MQRQGIHGARVGGDVGDGTSRGDGVDADVARRVAAHHHVASDGNRGAGVPVPSKDSAQNTVSYKDAAWRLFGGGGRRTRGP